MTTSSYLIAWIIYLLASAGINAVFWNLSMHWRNELKYVTRVSLLVVLLTPYFSDPDKNRLAPAILISLFEFAFGDIQMGLQSGAPLLLLLLSGAALAFIYAVVRRKIK